MKCQRCLSGEEATYRVRSDVIEMSVCAACATEARRLGLAVEILGGGERKGNGEKKNPELRDYRSELLP
jgi:hypothetical protein